MSLVLMNEDFLPGLKITQKFSGYYKTKIVLKPYTKLINNFSPSFKLCIHITDNC